VLIREGRILIATFHPELTSDAAVHRYFLGMISGNGASPRLNDPMLKTASSR
jgi:hypothetical protein